MRIEEHGADEDLQRVFDTLDRSRLSTGLLHDRVISFVDVARFDGAQAPRVATLDSLRQLYYELVQSAVHPEHQSTFPTLEAMARSAEPYLREDVVPLAVTSIQYNKLKPDALERQLLRLDDAQLRDGPPGPASPYETHLAFAAAPLRRQAYHPTVYFVLPPELYITNHGDRATFFEVDFGDGRGPLRVAPGEVVSVRYAAGGHKTLRLTAREGNRVHHAVTVFEVASITVPEPDRSWLDQTAGRAYASGSASYDAHVFYGAGNTGVTNPVVFVEGFDAYYSDPAKRRTWQDMYLRLAEEGGADSLRARGYDLVLLKLHNATDYIQRNAFALEHLLGTLNAELPSGQQIVVVGPSMGGLIGRYALAFMEREGAPHNVRLFASLDAPYRGANIPLGDQFFIEFFDNDSEKAREGKAALNTVAARQQLIYHYRTFPYTDPLREELVHQLDALGYPDVRMVTMTDGSGYGLAQRGSERVGFRRMEPGDKIVEYRYRSFFIALDGDVWALPDTAGAWTRIFEGRKDVIGPHYRALDVYVRGTLPLDNAPGGTRGTQGEIAGGDVPYGRIHTSFPDHAWVPATSALDLDTEHPFYDVQADPANLLTTDAAGKSSTSTFDAVYYAHENEVHVKATPDNVRFLLEEIGPVPVPEGPLLTGLSPESIRLSAAYPNPFNPETGFTLSVATTQQVRVEVYNTLGQRVALLHDGLLAARETHRLMFNAGALSSGVYLLRVTGEAFTATRTMTLLK